MGESARTKGCAIEELVFLEHRSAELENELAVAKAFHDVAVRERDLLTVQLARAERERDEAREKLAACREAIKEYLKYHQHRMRREPGCRCGQCLEVDPNCPCHKLECALAATEPGGEK